MTDMSQFDEIYKVVKLVSDKYMCTENVHGVGVGGLNDGNLFIYVYLLPQDNTLLKSEILQFAKSMCNFDVVFTECTMTTIY